MLLFALCSNTGDPLATLLIQTTQATAASELTAELIGYEGSGESTETTFNPTDHHGGYDGDQAKSMIPLKTGDNMYSFNQFIASSWFGFTPRRRRGGRLTRGQ